MYPKHSPQRGTSSAPMGTNLSVSADPIPVAGASGIRTQPQGRPADSLIEAVSGVRRSDGLIIVPRATPLRCGIVVDIVYMTMQRRMFSGTPRHRKPQADVLENSFL